MLSPPSAGEDSIAILTMHHFKDIIVIARKSDGKKLPFAIRAL
jgi:hypothetical protein